MTDSRSAPQPARQPRTIAITGGKGGVGKTSVALNLALTLARGGSKVLLLDADTDLANVSIMLGRYPQSTLADAIAGTLALQDIIMSADYGLHILPGASGVDQCIDLDAAASLRVLKALSQLEKRYDYVITDTASGLQPTGMHMIAAAELACVVVTPDPASLTDAFSLIKLLVRRGYRRTPSILVNMAQGASQARTVFQRLEGAAQRHLGISLHYLGGIWRDETLRQSVLNQRPVALLPEADPSCRQFLSLVDMLKVRLRQISPKKAGVAAYWHRVSGKRPVAGPPATTPAQESPTDRQACQRRIAEIGELIAANAESSLLRYDAFNQFFALLGRTIDEDTIEILRAGLASLPWGDLQDAQRRQFAAQLRQLAADVEPPQPQFSPPKPVSGGPAPRLNSPHPALTETPDNPQPCYDHISFGEQHRLVQALKAQPSNVSLDQLLRALDQNNRNPN